MSDVSYYPDEFTPFDTSDPREVALRSPGRWLNSIKSPTFIIEGTSGNLGSLKAMQRSSTNSLVHFSPVQGASHFNVLGPVNRVIAQDPRRQRTDVQLDFNRVRTKSAVCALSAVDSTPHPGPEVMESWPGSAS